MNQLPPQRSRPDRRPGLLGAAAVLLLAVCCFGPVLIAGGALAGMGGVLADPCLIGAGAVLVAIAVVAARRRRRDGDSCCPPGEPHPETQHRTWTEEKSDHA